MLRRLQNALTTPLWPITVAGITFLFCLPALGLGLQTDDYGIALEVICDGDVFSLWNATRSFAAEALKMGLFLGGPTPNSTYPSFGRYRL